MLTFELGRVSDVTKAVADFRKAWNEQAVDEGVITSNFNRQSDLTIQLTHSSGPTRMWNHREIRLQESLALSFVVIAVMIICVVLITRWTKKYLLRSSRHSSRSSNRPPSVNQGHTMLPIEEEEEEDDMELLDVRRVPL